MISKKIKWKTPDKYATDMECMTGAKARERIELVYNRRTIKGKMCGVRSRQRTNYMKQQRKLRKSTPQNTESTHTAARRTKDSLFCNLCYSENLLFPSSSSVVSILAHGTLIIIITINNNLSERTTTIALRTIPIFIYENIF